MDKKIRTYRFKPLPIEIEVKDLAFVREGSQLLGRAHKAAFYQVVWLTRGTAEFRIDFREIALKADDVLIISAGQVCQFDTVSDYSGKMILFTDAFFTVTELDSNFLYTAEVLNPENLNTTVPVCPQLMGNMTSLLEEELKGPVDNYQMGIAHSFLQVILFETERKLSVSRPAVLNSLGRRFYHEVEEHFRENRNAEFYVERLGVNEKTLSREVKGLTGKTPKVYIDSRTILEAKRLLAYSDLSAKEIGFNLGFDEPTNFAKYFRRAAGMTPGQFRDSLKK